MDTQREDTAALVALSPFAVVVVAVVASATFFAGIQIRVAF